MSKNTKKTWQEIVNSNYAIGKVSPALKTDGTPFMGRAQMYLMAGVWCDKYHAKMEGLEIYENTARQVPKARGGYSTLYKVATEKEPPKKGGLKDVLQALQNYTGRKGTGKTDGQKAENLLKYIKKDLNKGEKAALNEYLSNFFKVIITADEIVSLEDVTKAVKIGYNIVTAKAKTATAKTAKAKTAKAKKVSK